jgi:crossover junction endodeoxyribonuclease RuvC
VSLVCGIDPGLDGAVALLSDDGSLVIHSMPTLMLKRGGKNRREIDPHVLADQIEEARPSHVFLERSWSRPEHGGIGSHTNGLNSGIVIGILAAFAIPYTLIAPQTWKRRLQVPAEKNGARSRASQLLPAHASNWRLVKDDGRAEAALIALYGRSQ